MKSLVASLAAGVTLCACASAPPPAPEVESVQAPPDFTELVSRLTDDLLEVRESAIRELCGKGHPALSAIRSAIKEARDTTDAGLLRAGLDVVMARYVASLGFVAFCSDGGVWVSRLDGSERNPISGARDSNENAFRPETFTPEGVLIIDSRDGLHAAAAPSWELKPFGPRLKYPEDVIFDRSARRWRFGDEVLVQDRNPFYGLRSHREGKWTALERTQTEFVDVAVSDYEIARDKTGRLLVASACSVRDAPRLGVIDPQRRSRIPLHAGMPGDGVAFQWNPDETVLAVSVDKSLFTWDGSAFKPIFEGRDTVRSVSWSPSGRRLALLDWRDRLHVVDLEGRLLWTHPFRRPVARLDIEVTWMDEDRFGALLKRWNPWGRDREEHSLVIGDLKSRSVQVVAEDPALIFGKLQAVRGEPGMIYHRITRRGEWHSNPHSELPASRTLGVDLFFYSLEDSKSYRISRTGLLQGGESDETDDFKTSFWDARYFMP